MPPSCLCWLTPQVRHPLTCDTSLHISINTHLAQLQLNNNTHHYVATVFAKTVPVSMITVSLGPCLGSQQALNTYSVTDNELKNEDCVSVSMCGDTGGSVMEGM